MICNKCNGKGKNDFKPIPFGCGSMGYNFPAAVGFALSKKIKKEEGNVYCLISDGECQIGSTWEAAMIAAHHQLDNLILIVDKNGLQAMGETRDVLNIDPLHDKFKSFGWHAEGLDGHDLQTLEARLTLPPTGNPRVFIAETTKGQGVSFMRNNNLWHYSHVSEETLNNALKELT